MNVKEVAFWCAIYWSLYLTMAFVLWSVTGQGALLPIVLIGAGLTSVLAGVLSLFGRRWEREVTIVEKVVVPEPVQEEQSNELEVENYDEEPIEEPEPKMRVDDNLGELDDTDDATSG